MQARSDALAPLNPLKVTDITKIAARGVTLTPALLIDDEIEKWLG